MTHGSYTQVFLTRGGDVAKINSSIHEYVNIHDGTKVWKQSNIFLNTDRKDKYKTEHASHL